MKATIVVIKVCMVSWIIHTFWLVLTYDLLGDRHNIQQLSCVLIGDIFCGMEWGLEVRHKLVVFWASPLHSFLNCYKWCVCPLCSFPRTFRWKTLCWSEGFLGESWPKSVWGLYLYEAVLKLLWLNLILEILHQYAYSPYCSLHISLILTRRICLTVKAS